MSPVATAAHWKVIVTGDVPLTLEHEDGSALLKALERWYHPRLQQDAFFAVKSHERGDVLIALPHIVLVYEEEQN